LLYVNKNTIYIIILLFFHNYPFNPSIFHAIRNTLKPRKWIPEKPNKRETQRKR